MAKHEELPIPIYDNLEPVYGAGSALEEAQLRFDIVKSKFVEVFGHHPQIFARSPGSSFSLFEFLYLTNGAIFNFLIFVRFNVSMCMHEGEKSCDCFAVFYDNLVDAVQGE